MSLLYIVDDDEPLLDLYQTLFQRHGHEVRTFTRAAPAAQAFAERPPDLWIVDLTLPDRPGLELIAHIRSSDAGAELPILLVSGYVETERRTSQMEALGIDLVLPKAFPAIHLPDLVRSVLAARG